MWNAPAVVVLFVHEIHSWALCKSFIHSLPWCTFNLLHFSNLRCLIYSSYIRHRFIISVFHKFMMILCLPHVHTNNQLKAFFHTILWVWHSTWLEHWTSFEISTMSSPVQWVLPITIHAISFKPCSSADTKAISEQWTSANIQGLFDSL